MEYCSLCPRHCNALRTQETGAGHCHASTLARVARAAPHLWEEPCISGTKGSGAVFFSGCALGCVFCQNHAISRQEVGQGMTAKALAQLFTRVEALGVHNLNLVTPTHHWPLVLEALALAKPGIPVIWNSSGYETQAMVAACRGLVDVFLPDFKFASAKSGSQLAAAPDYFETALAAIQAMCAQTGPPTYTPDGLIIRGTLVRHLVLPLRVNESIAILDAIHSHLPPGTPVSLMRQFTPLPHIRLPGLNRPLTGREYGRARAHMLTLGLPGYFQQKDAADSAYTPTFLDSESTRLFPHTEP